MDDNLRQDEIEELLRQAESDSGGSADEQKPASADAAEPPHDGDKNLGREEIEQLLEKSSEGQPAAATSSAAPAEPSAANSSQQIDADVQFLLKQAEEALRSVDEPHENSVAGLAPFELKQLTGAAANTERASLELLRDVELDMRIELGRTHMYLEDVLQLRKGAVVPLDKLAGDPVDVYVNGRLVARGEVLVLNDNFCVRIAELISGEEIEQRETA
jgi:flagellar motor switch protein FliN/FliY